MKKIIVFIGIVTACIGIYLLVNATKEEKAPNILDTEKFLLIAHRGASAYSPEHTLMSYQMAKDMAADYIEIDLQMTKDGVLVALHDDSVDRTTDGSGKIADMDLDEMKELDAGSWFNRENPGKAEEAYIGSQIPTLQEIFEKFGHSVNYYIEIKQPQNSKGMEKQLLELLGQFGLLDKSLPPGKVVIQSFSADSLKLIHELNSNIPLIQLMDNLEQETASSDTFESFRKYAKGIGVSYVNVDKASIAAAREAGLLIHPFTVDDPETIEKLKSWGANGVFTNDIKAFQRSGE